MTKKQPKNQRIEWRIQFDYIIITSYNDLIWFLSFPFSLYICYQSFSRIQSPNKEKNSMIIKLIRFRFFFVFIGKHWIHTAKQERRRTSFFHSFSIRVKKDKDKERSLFWSWMNNKMILQMIHCIKFFFLLLLLGF